MVNKNNFVNLGLIRTFTMTNFAILLRWVYVCGTLHVCVTSCMTTIIVFACAHGLSSPHFACTFNGVWVGRGL